ncbi:hypothetical protein [Pendulispora albinea]|uniref:Uncharacterized protein n=1 Tax=Pendulispora albinea TaxID=2741071 RepID=A0ABZ2LZ98_9BACT
MGALLLALLLLASLSTGYHPVGYMRGISLDIDPAFGPRVSAASVSICWNGSCRTPFVELSRATEVVDMGCDGGTCVGQVALRAGKYARIVVPDLSPEPVRVTLNLADAAGSSLLAQTIEVTPKMVGPWYRRNGGPQAHLEVTANGTFREAPPKRSGRP